MMVGMKINKKPFWVRHADVANNIAVYTPPEMVYINLFPTNGESDLAALGADYIEYMRAKLPVAEAKRYTIGDLIYDSEPRFKDLTDVGNATYRVNAILPVLNVTEILCKRMSGAVK